MKRYLLASACALACSAVATPSFADGIAGTADGTFGNVLGHPSWSATGVLNVPLNWSDLSVEGAIGDSGVSIFHVFNGGGSLVWSQPDFRLAGSVVYNRVSIGGGSFDETQYGGGAEWFANPWLSLSALGGGITGSSSGSYVGGDVKGYVMPNLAFDGFVNYLSLASTNETDYGVHGEWLFCDDFPVSVGGTYDHIDFGGGGNTDTWLLQVKFYFNDSPASTLVDRQRTGTLDTIRPSFKFLF
jgi:hypothetical protein